MCLSYKESLSKRTSLTKNSRKPAKTSSSEQSSQTPRKEGSINHKVLMKQKLVPNFVHFLQHLISNNIRCSPIHYQVVFHSFNY
ncbi:unnamed protein product [Larinioides sclopetarius]|uniref:Uncharacterized protein n=1 Tax=Larinioides sclopetarius TaxID=280406 RepID=A0AAV2A095_9ARAC